MVSVGYVTLHDGLVWTNEFDNPAISTNVRRTLGGGLNIQQANIIKGREIELSTTDVNGANKAYLTRANILALKAIERAGSPVVFVHGNETIQNVLIVPGSIETQPLGSKKTPDSDDVYVGSFKLIEV